MIQTIKLSNEIEMPLEGYGVFQVTEQTECKRAVLEAIQTGSRLVDTAYSFQSNPTSLNK